MRMLPVAVLLTASLAGAAEPPARFTDITASAGIPALRHGEGVNIVDLDGDELPELYLACVRDQGRLLKNLGHGRFREMTAEAGLDQPGGVGAGVGDLNGDGRPDLFIARGADPYVAPNLLYLQGEDGRFRDASHEYGVAAFSNGLSVTLADFDGDGRLDAFLPGWGADNLFCNQGGESLQEIGARAGLGPAGRGWASLATDIDGDGDRDLLVTRGSFSEPHDNRLYRNDGSGHFEEITAESGLSGSPWSLGAVSADFDGDGDFDLYIAGYSQRGRLFRNDGGGRFQDVTNGSGLTAAKSVGAAAGPVDGDLLPDLVVGGFAGPAELYRNLGGMKFERVGAGSGLQDHNRNEGVALADIDDDGDLDLYVTNVEGHNRLYRNNLDDPRYLKVGFAVSGSSREGTVVRLSRNGRLLAVQELAGTVGMGQGPRELLFRLPDDGPFELVVILPDGRRIERQNVSPGKLRLP